MANKDRQKRSVRQARSRERAEREAELSAQGAQELKKADASSVQAKKSSKSESKPGIFSGITTYFKEVKSELKRVVWPSKSELKNYSVAIICTLIVFGICVWLVDTGFVGLLVAFTGLRG